MMGTGKRTRLAFLCNLSFAIGVLTLPTVAYILRHWYSISIVAFIVPLVLMIQL